MSRVPPVSACVMAFIYCANCAVGLLPTAAPWAPSWTWWGFAAMWILEGIDIAIRGVK